ncbi:MAG TPA: ABC transporter permease [Terracidiphilus sp.]|nr:ABC transporter permease [Terracidiphilus sp.]
MDWIRILFSRVRAFFNRRVRDAELDEELRAHIDLAAEENLRKGMSAGEARTAALRAFGGVTQTREQYRIERGLPGIEEISRDARIALRQLRRSPGFALTAILTLALGIGAVTAMFSVVNTVLLKPFAFPDQDRLVVVREVEVQDHGQRIEAPDNYRHIMRLKNTAKTLEDIAIFQTRGLSVSPSGDRPNIIGTLEVSPNFFHVLGVQPAMGRDFLPSEARAGADHVLILSYEGWQTLLQGDPRAIGKTVRVSGEPYTVVGILPAEVRFPQIALAHGMTFQEAAIGILMYAPFTPSGRDLSNDTGGYNYKSIARLKPGVTLAEADAELEGLQQAYSLSAHLPLHLGIAVTPLAKDVTANISGALWMLFAAVGSVLLIACVNLANLQLARAANAERETAVRAALGASRARLFRLRMTESLVLAAMGGVAGAALAIAGVRLLIAMAPKTIPRLDEVHVSLPVLAFAAFVSIVSALVFGALPALRSLRVPPQSALQASSTRVVSSRQGRRTRGFLVAGQVACTLTLLVVMALVLRSFSRLLHQDLGFDTSHVTVAEVDLFAPQYGDFESAATVRAAKLAFADRVLTALRQLPGVQSASITSAAPLTGEDWVDNVQRPDHPVPPADELPINVRWIDQDYLRTMQIPLVSGRNFTADDRANPMVALISEQTAREAFAGENPVGKELSNLVPDSPANVRIVGVVADTRINGLRDQAAMVYIPYWAFTHWTLSFLVRSPQPANALIPEMRRVIWQADPKVAIPAINSLDDQVNDSVASERFQAMVLTSFGAVALLLAALGVYGVLAYSVSLRRQEFGIRIALGSGKGALVQLVLRQAAVPVLLGSGAGLLITAAVLRWVRSLLYQTPVADPVAILGSVVLLLAAAVAAAIIPAREAAELDPMRALRTD